MPELLLLLATLLRTIAAETETVATEPDTADTYTSLDQVETVEGFMRTREFKVDTEHDTGLMSTSWPAGVSWGARSLSLSRSVVTRGGRICLEGCKLQIKLLMI